MRLKMARNSLFAVLLRSSWWISLAVALVVAAASRALLPTEYWVFGAMGSFPFVVIAGIALLKQPGVVSMKGLYQNFSANHFWAVLVLIVTSRVQKFRAVVICIHFL